MVSSLPTKSSSPTRSKLEGLKQRSHYLRSPLQEELRLETHHFSGDAVQILKFHGSYQQDNRDNRVKGQEKDYSMMLRTRCPGGFIPPELYLTLDHLADTYGNGTLRATTRQAFQLHGILKSNLKATLAAIIRNMGSTLGACGDLNRNVMTPPAPLRHRPAYEIAKDYANRIADLLTPQTGAYYEIWLDGEKAISAEEHPEIKAARLKNTHGTNIEQSEEPIYGEHYMPRKFKIAVTVPGDNSIDLYTQDLGLIVITTPDDKLKGFNITVGGGMGRTHNKEDTFARVADHLGYVDRDDIYDVVKAIVATQRDYGDRTQRRYARMKYLVHDWGIAKFKQKVEEYFGKPIQPFKPLPQFEYLDYLGWHEQGDGKLFLGISVENGRVKDEGNFQLKSALKTIVEQYRLPLYLTGSQDIILSDIQPQDRLSLQALLNRHGVKSIDDVDPLNRFAMACPALPTCGLAITESERVLPSVLDRIKALLQKVGLENEHFVTRMTGCPNGCARPYMAELGFVGQTPGCYQLWLGGSPNQTRLAFPFMEKAEAAQLETVLEPLFVYFKQARIKGKRPESFGDFCYRIGKDGLLEFSAHYDPSMLNALNQLSRTKRSDKGRVRYRVNLREDVFRQLKESAHTQGRTLADIASDAIDAYLKAKADGEFEG
ncbi:sulfite reductase, ferredoxin dependent [Lyngbya confervoides]|uniref:Sulfite reductase [ferredoxin] n=1 Tax=Lyngbya confervoides BDU141951 TaxID=1574623 RepID=A0ABD4T3U5_9CYAN|nr:sulfite reductase, ferredoxin dependent [Lyngbya confervoides]MCM1983182.1 sulfite reductase, ferredoxin dependent [Lyngbya confervoides BDU141951]